MTFGEDLSTARMQVVITIMVGRADAAQLDQAHARTRPATPLMQS
jgi:hypothetical protein